MVYYGVCGSRQAGRSSLAAGSGFACERRGAEARRTAICARARAGAKRGASVQILVPVRRPDQAGSTASVRVMILCTPHHSPD